MYGHSTFRRLKTVFSPDQIGGNGYLLREVVRNFGVLIQYL